MVILISGTDKQLSILKSVLRERVSLEWYTYDFIPKQILEYLNISSKECELTIEDKRLLKDMTEAFEKHSDICFRDCMSVIRNFNEEPTAKFLFVVVPNQKIQKFKNVDALKVNVILDTNLVSGSLKYEKHSLYDYALYNAHDKKTMGRKVSEFLRYCEGWMQEHESN